MYFNIFLRLKVLKNIKIKFIIYRYIIRYKIALFKPYIYVFLDVLPFKYARHHKCKKVA